MILLSVISSSVANPEHDNDQQDGYYISVDDIKDAGHMMVVVTGDDVTDDDDGPDVTDTNIFVATP